MQERNAVAGFDRNFEKDTITIDSDCIQIVHDLRGSEWDMQYTLVEVDEIALVHMVLDFRWLITQHGPDMSFTDTKDVLEKMIEDARRLW